MDELIVCTPICMVLELDQMPWLHQAYPPPYDISNGIGVLLADTLLLGYKGYEFLCVVYFQEILLNFSVIQSLQISLG